MLFTETYLTYGSLKSHKSHKHIDRGFLNLFSVFLSIGPTLLIKFPIYLGIFFFCQQSFVFLMHSVVNFGSVTDLWQAAHVYFAGRVQPVCLRVLL